MVNAHTGRAIKCHLWQISQSRGSTVLIWRYTRGQEDTTALLEKMAIVIMGERLTTDAGQEVWYALGQEEARRFYMGALVMNGSTNTGGLGWTQYKFNQVSWKSINATLRTKPDMFQIWHAKQNHPIPNGPHPRHPGQQVPKLPTGEGNKPTPEPLPGPLTNPSFLRERQTPGKLDAWTQPNGRQIGVSDREVPPVLGNPDNELPYTGPCLKPNQGRGGQPGYDWLGGVTSRQGISSNSQNSRDTLHIIIVPHDWQRLDEVFYGITATDIAFSVTILELHPARQNKGLPVLTT
jgi:hypothetical protein